MMRSTVGDRTATAAGGFRLRAVGTTRLEAFSDAVFAFALALLVVSANVPTTAAELFATLRQFPAFGLTFAVLVWLWHMHVVYFRRYGLDDAVTAALNAVLLLVILFYVYPLKFMFTALYRGFSGDGWTMSFADGRALMLVYSAGFVAVFLMLTLLYGHALRLRAQLELDPVEELLTRAGRDANGLLVGLGLVSIVVMQVGSRWAVPASGYLYGLIGPLMWWHWRRVDRRLAALRAATEPRADSEPPPV